MVILGYLLMIGAIFIFLIIRRQQNQREKFIQGRRAVTPRKLAKAIKQPSSFKDGEIGDGWLTKK
jgi:hypothetical protein